MLGSLHDADDALQDTLLRAWRALPKFRGDSSPRTWLHRIATNVCLDMIALRRRRILPVDYGPPTPPGASPPERMLPKGAAIEPYPDESIGVPDAAPGPEARFEQRESLELAFVAALQHLPARQRAVLILRDVLGYSAKESAQAMAATVPSVNGALRRAREALDRRLPDESQQVTLRALGDRKLREVAERFADSLERGEVEAILATLTENATVSTPPYEGWHRGRDGVAESWLMPSGPPPRLAYATTRANGQIALGTYLIADDRTSYLPLALDVLTLRADLISDVTIFRTPELFSRFALPPSLPA
jgi:RNA polymerase sigma-70 factor (ECF subfamily)